MFWLNGMAGTGKSTISRTIARSLAAAGLLGASFFFKRGQSDRSRALKFCTTIAAQLATRQPSFAKYVRCAIDTDPGITQKSIHEQFNKLILDPYSKVEGVKNATTFIVVDGLDECEDEDDLKLLIQLFCSTTSELRFFVASRPELPVRLSLNTVNPKYQTLILHEVPLRVVKNDIAVFLDHELARIRNEFNFSVSEDRKLPTNWPSQSDFQNLVEMSAPLFIFAATVCRFLADRKTGSPTGKLSTILEHKTKNCGAKFGATYSPILQQQLEGLSLAERDTAIQDTQAIIGSILLLANPLTTRALAAVLDIPKVIIDDRLDLFHSVLSIPVASNSPVRPLHLSFRDFLTDPEGYGRNPFWIDQQETHQNLATNCLRVMSRHLSKNICELEWPGIPRSAIDLPIIQQHLPAEVQYACLFWTHHLEGAHQHIYDDSPAHNFLLRHFLHWVEAFGLLGRISEGLDSVKTLISLLSVSCLEPHREGYMLTN